MSLILEKKQLELPDEGTHLAVVEDVIDLGIVDTKFGEKDKAVVVWKLEAKDSKGEAFRVHQRFTKSPHYKSPLFKAIRTITGADPSSRFDLTSLKGRKVELEIEHHKSETDLLIYPNVVLIRRLKTTAEKLSEERITNLANGVKRAARAHDEMVRNPVDPDVTGQKAPD